MSTTARVTTEIWGTWGRRIWLEGNNEKNIPVYILEEKVRSAKRDTSSHQDGQLFGAVHVIVR